MKPLRKGHGLQIRAHFTSKIDGVGEEVKGKLPLLLSQTRARHHNFFSKSSPSMTWTPLYTAAAAACETEPSPGGRQAAQLLRDLALPSFLRGFSGFRWSFTSLEMLQAQAHHSRPGRGCLRVHIHTHRGVHTHIEEFLGHTHT